MRERSGGCTPSGLAAGVLLWAILLWPGGGAQSDEPRRFLFYGNSFTIGIGSAEAEAAGGVPGIVQALAAAAGHPPPQVENAAVSGQSLAWHLANNLSVIADPQDFVPPPGFQWDAVVIQDFSTRPTYIGDLAAFRADVLSMYEQVRGHSPGVVPILYETWARGPGHEFYSGSDPVFPGGPAEMQQQVRDGYLLARSDIDAAYGLGTARIAPVGDAFENSGWDNLYSDDLYHANSRGTYLAALVIFGTIYSERTSGLPPVLASIAPAEAAVLQTLADGVIPNVCGFAGPDCNANCIPDRREADCNGNATPDDCDISAGTSRDCNADGIPDECSSAPVGDAIFCLTGPCSPPDCYPASPEGCCLLDGDRDGDIDLADFAVAQAVYTGPAVERILVDFGSTALQTTGQPEFWNNIHPGDMTTPLPLMNAAGEATDVTLTIAAAQRFNSANTSGTTSPPAGSPLAARGYPPTATQDSLFGNDVWFEGGVFPVAVVTLSGLTPGASYTLLLTASRMGVTDIRTTDFVVSGATTIEMTLDVANNDTNLLVASGIVPTSAGTLTITVDKGESNNNAYGFYYLGVLELERVVP